MMQQRSTCSVFTLESVSAARALGLVPVSSDGFLTVFQSRGIQGTEIHETGKHLLPTGSQT